MARETIGGRLVRARKAAGLTQYELADRSGVSFRVIQSCEQGRTLPDLLNTISIAEALDVSLDWLTGRECVAGENTGMTLSRLKMKINDLIEKEWAAHDNSQRQAAGRGNRQQPEN